MGELCAQITGADGKATQGVALGSPWVFVGCLEVVVVDFPQVFVSFP